jgi:hypothetical protein
MKELNYFSESYPLEETKSDSFFYQDSGKGYMPKHLYANTFLYLDHKYVYFKLGDRMSILHSPDCFCQRHDRGNYLTGIGPRRPFKKEGGRV